MTGPATASVAEALTATARQLDAQLADSIRSICSRADDPPTIAIAGHVSSGKSTLVNALVGRRVAPTDAGECTKVVSRFRFGRSERVVVHSRDGAARSLPLDEAGLIPTRLGLAVDEVDHLEVRLSVRRLREMELVDTPGLAASSGAGARTKSFLGMEESSRVAVGRADAVVYLLHHTGLDSEAADLAAFGTGAGGRADAAIGVLAKADQLAGGDHVAAADLSERLAKQLADRLWTVLPVWTLVAETVACGRLREADAATVAAVADLDASERDVLLAAADLFTEHPVAVPTVDRRRLIDLLAPAGARRAVDAARSGARGAAALTAALDRVSGRDELERAVDRLARRADVLRAARMIADAARAAWTAGPSGEALRDAIEALQQRPEMHRLEEARALDAIESGRVALGPTDVAQALDVLRGELPPSLDMASAIDRWRVVENTTADLETQRVAQTVARSLTLLREPR